MTRTAPSAALVVVLAVAAAPCSHAGSTSTSLAITSDYVFRGISQSRGDPALQAGIGYRTDGGWYASAWGSTVRFAPEVDANAEIDLVAGWTGTLAGDWTADVNLTRFWYPGTAIESDYTEVIAAVEWAGTYRATVGHSPDVFATGEPGTWVQASARWPVAQVYRVEAAIGHYRLTDAYGDSYRHWQLGVVRSLAPLELRLTVHGTDSAAKALFPDLAGTRVEFAVHASF